jgi:glucose/arabinose dehydrogenase
MSVRLRTLGLVAAVALLGSGLLTTSSAGAATPRTVPVLLSQNRPVTASSSGGCCPAKNAVDGKSSTRWASAAGGSPQWIVVDLGTVARITRVRLEWDKSCATAYRIEASIDRATWSTVHSTTTGKGGIEDLTVSGSGRYVRAYLTHRCRNVAGKGYSLREFQVFGFTGTDVPPGPPRNVRASAVTCTSIEISWDPPDNITPAAYDIFTDGQFRLTVPGDVTHAVLTGLVPGLAYGITVLARDAAGNYSPPSDVVIVVLPSCPEPVPPSAPTDLHVVSVNANCVTIGWTASTEGDVVAYNVYTLSGGSRVRVASSTTTTATICGLTLGVSYTFVVTALDAAGNESGPSNPLQVVLPPPVCDTAPVCAVDPVTTSTAVPWGLVTLPDGSILFTERDSFNLVHASPHGPRTVVGHVPNGATTGGEGGLTGLEISPTFGTDHWLYFFHTTATDNRIVRIRYQDGALNLATEQVLLTGIARNRFHNGGRLRFGPDGRLYAGTGDAQNGANAPNLNSLNGKILRLNPDGTVPSDNPFPGKYVWSYGHRNVEGLAFDAQGRLWASELGDTRQDELDLVTKGGNYGWPKCEGTLGDCAGSVAPVRTFAPSAASPGGIAIVNGVIYLAALRGMRLYRMVITGNTTAPPTVLFPGVYGRLRTVEPAPGGGLWLTTSNGDGLDRTPVDRVLHVTLA